MSDWRKGAHIEGVIADHKMMGFILEQCQEDNGKLRKRIAKLEADLKAARQELSQQEVDDGS